MTVWKASSSTSKSNEDLGARRSSDSLYVYGIHHGTVLSGNHKEGSFSVVLYLVQMNHINWVWLSYGWTRGRKMSGKTILPAQSSCYLAAPASPGSGTLQRGGWSPPGVTWGDVCQPYAPPAAGTLPGRERMTPVLREAHFWSVWQLSRHQTRSNRGRKELRPHARPLQLLSQPFWCLTTEPVIKAEPRDTEQKDMTAGNAEEWRVRKLINAEAGLKPLPLGIRRNQWSCVGMGSWTSVEHMKV